jgi:hypothetical protein
MKFFPLTLLAGILLTSCAGGSNTSSIRPASPAAPIASPTAPVGESASTPRPDEATEGGQTVFEGTAGIVDRKGSGTEAAVLNAVRAASHPEYDRIVFEFAGNALPGYHVEYVDKPVRSCGSGEVVPLTGDGWLEIRMTPAAAHDDTGQSTVKTREISLGLAIVKELKLTCDFEADVTWVAGVSSPNKYRVLELANPTRLVVDIKH